MPDCSLEVSVHPEGPATGQLDQDFRGFPLSQSKCWVGTQIRPCTACFSCSPPNYNFPKFRQYSTSEVLPLESLCLHLLNIVLYQNARDSLHKVLTKLSFLYWQFCEPNFEHLYLVKYCSWTVFVERSVSCAAAVSRDGFWLIFPTVHWTIVSLSWPYSTLGINQRTIQHLQSNINEVINKRVYRNIHIKGQEVREWNILSTDTNILELTVCKP
jgi:hypothetical protein